MSRTTGAAPATALAATALTATALAVGLTAVPANAEAVVYETRNVHASLSDGGSEWAALGVPTGYERDRLNRHAVAFVERSGAGRVIRIDLAPRHDTLAELKREREALEKRYPDSYREFAFKVNDRDAKVRVKWVYTFAAEGTEDTEPYISDYLMGHDRVRVVGKVSEREQVNFIRNHVVSSVVFPG